MQGESFMISGVALTEFCIQRREASILPAILLGA